MSVDDKSADKPFSTAGVHTVHIVESWEKPVPIPMDNSTDVTACDATLAGQKFTYTTKGELKDLHGLCVDGACANFSVGCEPLALKECDGSKSQHWTRGKNNQFVNSVVQDGVHGCMDLWDSGRGPDVGIYTCGSGSGDLGQQWTATAHGGYKTASVQPGQSDRCLTNGDGGKSGGSMTVHVYLARSIYVATDRTYICCL